MWTFCWSNRQAILIILLLQILIMTQARSDSPNDSREPEPPRFQCTCGRQYKSKPAVYTHIKLKHNNDQSTYHIIDLQKGEVKKNRAFRVDRIEYDELESGLMTLADTTFARIFGVIKEGKGLRVQDYLLGDDYLSDSEEDQKRDDARVVEERLVEYELGQLWEIVKEKYGKEMQDFKLNKRVLNINREICKHFIPSFSVKVETELALQWLRLSNPKNPNIQRCSSNLWQQKQQGLKQAIIDYFTRWRQLKRQ